MTTCVRCQYRWLICDVDMLLSNEAVQKWLAGFEGVEPTAKRVAEEYLGPFTIFWDVIRGQ